MATLAVVAIVAAVASAAVGTVATVQASKFKARVAQINEDINRDNAKRAVSRSQIEAQEQDRISRELIGEEIAKQSASGLSVRSGSFALKRKSLRELARKDALTIRQAGDVEAFNFLTQAAVNKAEAKAADREGTFALIQGGLSIVSSVAGGISGGSSISGAATTGSKIGGAGTSLKRTGSTRVGRAF